MKEKEGGEQAGRDEREERRRREGIPKQAEEADKIEVAPRVTLGNLRRFRAAVVVPAQGSPGRPTLRR